MGKEEIQHFASNPFNLCASVLQNMPIVPEATHKGRGVVTTQDIATNTIVCLFPGEEVFRFPKSGMLPRENWAKRTSDQRILDAEEAKLPISDYAIRVSVLDFDESGHEIGYHWRILEPMATNPDFVALTERLNTLHFEEPSIVALPDAWNLSTDRQSKLIYAKLRAMRQIPLKNNVATHKNYQFYVTQARWSPDMYVVMRIDDNYHYICLLDEVTNETPALENIKLAINTTFDAHSQRKHQLLNDIKDLKLRNDYPYIGAFINHPYDFEEANLRFVDPHEWISNVRTGKWQVPSHLATLVDHDLENKDLLQRQALVSRKFIPSGSELLVNYGRDL